MSTAHITKKYLFDKLDAAFTNANEKIKVSYGVSPNGKSVVAIDVYGLDWDNTALYASTGGRAKVTEAYNIKCGIQIDRKVSGKTSMEQVEQELATIYEQINEAVHADITLGGNVQRALCVPIQSGAVATQDGFMAKMTFQVSCKTNNS